MEAGSRESNVKFIEFLLDQISSHIIQYINGLPMFAIFHSIQYSHNLPLACRSSPQWSDISRHEAIPLLAQSSGTLSTS